MSPFIIHITSCQHATGTALRESCPVHLFTAEDPEIRFNYWLPALERAAVWKDWSEEETLMQLAGYFRNRALQ